MIRLTLEYAVTPNRKHVGEADLGLVDFIEVQDGWINAFVGGEDDPPGEDTPPDVKYMFECQADGDVVAWHLREEDMNVDHNNWVYRGRRLNILPA